ncbi:MAG: UDP-N-acetylmuramate--L-alanine ligase [Aeriscardovia sp.]|nr:UDP-N-acetylmuramate--L-alanine ligase [Aeriscardovia sp.]
MSSLPSPAFSSLEGKSVKDLKSVFFSGIGGHGMSVLAMLLNAEGVKVSGSDIAETKITKELKDAKIPVYPQDGSHMDGSAVLVWSSAIKEGNPDLASAEKSGMTLAHRSDILDLLMREKEGIAVSGTHGKTTTSSLISSILLAVGKDPSWALGSSFRTKEGNEEAWRKGAGAVFVAEADESDSSLLKYRPKISVITNSDGDHFDHFGTIENYRKDFLSFIKHSEKCVICMDDEGNRKLFGMLCEAEKGKILGYGVKEFKELGLEGFKEEKYAMLNNIRFFPASSPVSSSFSLSFAGKTAQVELKIPGLHNCLNASAAILACTQVGVDFDSAAHASSLFLGCSRRFELLGCENGIRLFTDYGHHPTELKALLSSLKSSYPSSRIGALFQPFDYSRVKDFAKGYAQSLCAADEVVVLPIYGARQDPANFPGVTANRIKEAAEALGEGEKFEMAESLEDGAKRLASWSHKGDVLVTIGAGSVLKTNTLILKLLKEKL